MITDTSFSKIRKNTLHELELKNIDFPMRSIIKNMNNLTHCFTVQSCSGHIIENGKKGIKQKEVNIENLPNKALYQIAYLAIVLKKNHLGEKLYDRLYEISLINSSFIHFGSANWFWEDQNFLNSFVLQVVPNKFKHLDRFKMFHEEAKQWLKIRNIFLKELEKLYRYMKDSP